MKITCPCCGLRSHSEFSYGGDASRKRPDLHDIDSVRWSDYIFLRPNPRGLHREYWQHVHGCRQWLIAMRDTVSHDIISVESPSLSSEAEDTGDA